MKISLAQTRRDTFSAPLRRQRQRGMAVIVVLAFVSIMLLYLACNVRTIRNLGREVRSLEQRQIRRIELLMQRTNPAVALTFSAPVSTNQVPAPQ